MPKSPEKPMISIIIPTFQEGEYITNTMLNLRKAAKNFPIEIIVVDGGSVDDTVEKAKNFTNKVYRIGRGIAKARNFGAKHSNGDILLFMDADVFLPNGFAEKLVETFRNPEVVGATCNIMPLKPNFSEKIFFSFYNGLLRFISRFKPHSRGEFLAVRKSAFFALNGFNENLPCIEDHDLAIRLSKIGKFVYIKDLTVFESMRRFRKLGLPRVIYTWFIDYLFYTIRKKPVSKVWKAVR